MLKLSERRRRRQGQKLGAKFDRLVAQMREFGESAGGFAATHSEPGRTFTMPHVETMARAMVEEAKASINVPLGGLRAAGVKVDVALDEAALRAAFIAGFTAGVGPDAIASQGSA